VKKVAAKNKALGSISLTQRVCQQGMPVALMRCMPSQDGPRTAGPRATVVTPVQSAASPTPTPLRTVRAAPDGEQPPEAERKKVRIAAVGDLHLTRTPPEAIRPMLAYVNEHADILVLCGDLTDYGRVDEAKALAKELAAVRIEMVGVLGNHDHEAGHPEQVKHILRDVRVHVLDGDACEVLDVGFAGVKGFPGGFGRGTLGQWGESGVKKFVQEAIDESLRFESALARLRTDRKVALLHYSPVRNTVEGEPLEIFPFLGCSRLEEPLARFPVDVVFHGHAHKGTITGHTATGAPVYNVAMPLLLRQRPDRMPCQIVELD
jgi:Icc-related predicted phosphoesterase